MVNLANCCLLLLPCRITRLRRATYINLKFAKHKHAPLTPLGGTSRCFARQNCRAEHVNVPPGPLWRGWRCFAIIGLRIGVVSSGGPCAAVWRNGAGGAVAKQETESSQMAKLRFCGADEARKSTRTPFANPCRNAFYCVSLRVRLLNIVQNWGIIGARFNKETL